MPHPFPELHIEVQYFVGLEKYCIALFLLVINSECLSRWLVYTK